MERLFKPDSVCYLWCGSRLSMSSLCEWGPTFAGESMHGPTFLRGERMPDQSATALIRETGC